MNRSYPGLYEVMIPILSVVLLALNILKEILQMITEGKQYFIYTEGKQLFISAENIADLIAYTLVSICQCYYFFTGQIVNGYFFPDNGSHFEEFLLPAIMILHLNLVV